MKIVVVPDMQIPFHSEAHIKSLARFIRKFRPDQVLCVGDEIDFQTISRWSSPFEETSGRIGKDRDLTVDILWDLQITDLSRSNHSDRLFKKLVSRAPGLIGAPELELENFLKLKELGIRYHKKPYQFLPNWILIHGDEQGINPNAGLSALGAARKHGKNVVMGHTHRAGISSFTEASGGHLGRRLTGVEVGNLMDFKKASYTRGTANWQHNFTVIYAKGKLVTPINVPMEKDGSFIFEGKIYR
jgi:hypothetical protein